MKELDVFISGEIMNLCIPTDEFSKESKWYSWFNNPKIVKYLEQGVFPNTPEDQVVFFRSQKTDRLMLIISNKKEYMGIISLSKINLIKKTCDIAIVIDSSIDRKLSPYISLEAMARLTEHAFNVMGINRIDAGQHVELKGWQQRMELIGYKLEGLHQNGFIKGHEVSNSVSIACLYDDFKNIVNHRGRLWDSKENMRKRYEQLPKRAFVDMLNEYFEQERNAYYKHIFSL
jgi:RimJ/RimL family protein N-acetyltransferase